MIPLPNLTPLNSVFVLTLYVVSSAAGLGMIKSAAEVISVQYLIGCFFYVLGFAIWIGVIIRMFPLSLGFPLSAGALIVGTQIMGWLFLKEHLSLMHLGGIALVLAGIGVIYAAGETL